GTERSGARHDSGSGFAQRAGHNQDVAIQPFVAIGLADQREIDEFSRLTPAQGTLTHFFDQGWRRTDVRDVKRSQAAGMIGNQLTDFWSGESYGLVRFQNRTCSGLAIRGKAGWGVHGQNKSRPRGSGVVRESIDVLNRLGHGAGDRAAESGAEDGIDDDIAGKDLRPNAIPRS